MKTFINYFKHAVTVMTLSVTLSCSDDFLNDTVRYLDAPDGQVYALYISPERDAAEYPVYYSGHDSPEFSILSVPDWLNVSASSGQFVNNTAYITCSASVKSEYAEPGMYGDNIVINIDGYGKYSIPVFYVSEGNPDIATDIEYEGYLNIRNKGEGILVWNVLYCSEWIDVDSKQSNGLLTPYAVTSLGFKYNGTTIPDEERKNMMPGQITGQIVIESNDRNKGRITVDVIFYVDIELPSLSYSPYTVDFERAYTEREFYLSNYGNGVLLWQVEYCPEWITLEQTRGSLAPYEHLTLRLTCDRTGLPAGVTSDVITISTNDTDNQLFFFTVTCRSGSSSPENIVSIEGTVIDAGFDRQTDMLYLSTKQPDRLLVYDIKRRTKEYGIDLPKAPVCFSISEDKSRIAIGHEGKITLIDLNNRTIDKTVDVDCIIFDIEWGNGDRCYYTSNVSNGPLKWINATTGEYGEQSDVTLYEQTVIKKIPGQNYIITGQYSGYSRIFDAQTGEFVKTLNISLEQFWLSADGAYIFCPDRNVYRTSDFQSNTSILPVAQLKVNEYESIQWIDCDPDNLWALRKGYYADNRPEIWQLETVNYDIVKTLYYDEYHWATINGTYAEYPAEAHYVFAGREQNEIVAVKSLRDYGNVWALEYIPLF